jgi:hypothetical protein
MDVRKHKTTWIADFWRSEATSSVKVIDPSKEGDDRVVCVIPYEKGCNFSEALMKAKTIAASHDMREVLSTLVAYEDANSEGLSSGAPSAEEWRAAFEKARDILESIDYGSALIESELTHR